MHTKEDKIEQNLESKTSSIIIGEKLRSDLEYWCFSCSSDGRYIAAGFSDNLKVLDYTGETCLELPHEEVYSIAYSPDNRFIVTIDHLRQLRVWDVQTGQQLFNPPTGSGITQSFLSFSRDGQFLATISHSIITILNLRDITKTSYSKYNRHLYSVDYSSNCNLLTVASYNYCYQCKLNIQTGAYSVSRFEKGCVIIRSIKYSPNGSIIANGFQDGSICVQNAKNSKQLYRFKRRDIDNDVISFSPNGKYLLSGMGSKSIHQWDIARRRHRVVESDNVVRDDFRHSVQFSNDGESILYGTIKDKAIRIIKIEQDWVQ